jgi:hypothetical protein
MTSTRAVAGITEHGKGIWEVKMSKRVFKLGAGAAGLLLAAVLVTGLIAPAYALAAVKAPVVTAVSPHAGSGTGGCTVTIRGGHFTSYGKSVVRKVMFGAAASTHLHVLSTSSITVIAPGGSGTVHVVVIAKSGKSSARVPADRFAYRTATQMALKAGDGQSASTGAAVGTAPSVVVTDAQGKPVAGVPVAFAVATGGGSVKGSAAVTDATGIATAGAWLLGTAAGPNTLTATCAGLAGSPVTFTATAVVGVLNVEYNGTAVRSYSLAELQALTPFAGWAGLNKNPVIGPDAITGVRLTDIVQDALGTPLAPTQSVDVAQVGASPYDKKFTEDALVNLTGFSMYDATSGAAVTLGTLKGPLAAVLIYNDPAAKVMPAASGPLRFVIADATSENVVMAPTNASVSGVNQLNIFTP